jgi:predicted transporter
VPWSSETCTVSPLTSAALSVPLRVCAAVLVIRSVLLAPVSAEKVTPVPVVVGARCRC